LPLVPPPPPGCEIGVASTKAYTSQIVVITMMALALR
jgi:glucosamine 6-phosphate synthetase-like amidotransferase/phosphosugar isomerase protein